MMQELYKEIILDHFQRPRNQNSLQGADIEEHLNNPLCGDEVTIYQGVTLGGTGFATGKRHPTVEDNVTIGSGAKLLGPITVGHGSKIGANAVVIHDVPPNSTVVGNPGHPVRVEGRRPEGPDADWVHLPDPIADALKQLSRRIAELERELAALKGADPGAEAEVVPLRPVQGPSPAGG